MELEEIGARWDKFARAVELDPAAFASEDPEVRKELVFGALYHLARLVGASAIVVESSDFFSRGERLPLDGGELESYSEREWVCEVILEDEGGCEVTVLAVRYSDGEGFEVFYMEAGEILESFLAGDPCESRRPPWEEPPLE